MAIQIMALGLVLSLSLIALVHVYWGLGGVWPAANAEALARAVVGRGGLRRMPPPLACFAVALALFGCALWVVLRVGWLAPSLPPLLMIVAGAPMSFIFLARGIAAYLSPWRRRLTAEPFATLDRYLYGPLCIAIGLGYLALLKL